MDDVDDAELSVAAFHAAERERLAAGGDVLELPLRDVELQLVHEPGADPDAVDAGLPALVEVELAGRNRVQRDEVAELAGVAATDLDVHFGFLLSPSCNAYDWLGSGIYFWEDAPERAMQWAVEMKKPHPAVVGAVNELVNCLNLLDVASHTEIAATYQTLRDSGAELPVNKKRVHPLDSLVRDGAGDPVLVGRLGVSDGVAWKSGRAGACGF